MNGRLFYFVNTSVNTSSTIVTRATWCYCGDVIDTKTVIYRYTNGEQHWRKAPFYNLKKKQREHNYIMNTTGTCFKPTLFDELEGIENNW